MGGGMATNDVTGTVGLLLEQTFQQITPYNGAATIQTISSTGAVIESPYGPSAPTFNLPQVMSGPRWFFVRDETAGGSGVFSTHSLLNIPVTSPVTLPVVDRNVMSTIAGQLPAPVVVDPSRSQVIMKIARGGQPLSGVSLNTPLPGSELVYDNGVGLYTNQTKQTGPGGVIILMNVDAPAVAELRQLTLTDVTGAGFIIELTVQAGTATIAGYTL